MKIAIISRSWFTDTKGGAERYIYEVCRELTRRGHEVTSISREETDLGNSHHKIWSPGISMIGSAVFSYLGTRKLRDINYDAVIVNQYWAEMASLFFEKPSILILHDVGLFESEIAQKSKLRHFFRERILRRVVKKPGKIVVPSKLTFNHLISYLDVPNEKIQIIPEGVDLNHFHPDENETSRDMILCTGRFSPNKGHILLIEAFKKFRNMTGWPGELVLAGHYTEKNKHYFESLREISDEKIKILTDINDEELASLYRQADFCVYPSVSDEGWGLVIVEAFASGKPVICSDLFLETGVASEERAYIVPRGDISSLVDAMRAMITSPEMKARLAAEGLAYANGLNWGKMVESIEKAICEVISENEKK